MDLIIIEPTDPGFPFLLYNKQEFDLFVELKELMPKVKHGYKKAIRENYSLATLEQHNMEYGLCSHVNNHYGVFADHLLTRIMSYYDICKISTVGNYGFVYDVPVYATCRADALLARIEFCTLIERMDINDVIVKE